MLCNHHNDRWAKVELVFSLVGKHSSTASFGSWIGEGTWELMLKIQCPNTHTHKHQVNLQFVYKNKVTPLLAAPWIQCIFWQAFSSFCEPLQVFCWLFIVDHCSTNQNFVFLTICSIDFVVFTVRFGISVPNPSAMFLSFYLRLCFSSTMCKVQGTFTSNPHPQTHPLRSINHA